jgi:anti-sigma regulatory factor (Ser/Thr protein kinase)
VSELVTNAVAASADPLCPVRVWLTSDGKCVAILVSDSNPQPPIRVDAGLETEGGRGLLLVDVVSAKWGWYPVPGGQGKVVWALIGEGVRSL